MCRIAVVLVTDVPQQVQFPEFSTHSALIGFCNKTTMLSGPPFVVVNPLKPSGHYMYHIHEFCVLPTQCINVFCVDLRTNSDYFTVQH
jgi:hypothetical protein